MSSLSVASLLHLRSETKNSCPDFKGQNYKASFSTRSSAKGPRKKIYRAHLEGEGPRKGEHAVVKMFRSCPGTEAMCDAEIAKNVMARKFARKFNKLVTEQTDKINFTLPLKSTVEQFGIGALLLRHSRHLDKMEWVLIEENLTHHDDNDSDPPKFCLFLRKNGDRASKDPTSLDAFIHYSYIESGQKFVMCGFQGTHSDDKGYTLTTPCLHSVHKLFGATDKGKAGIKAVFSKHKCNNLCYKWPKPSDHLDPEDANVHVEDDHEGVDDGSSSGEDETETVHVNDSCVKFGVTEGSISSEDSKDDNSSTTDASLCNGHAKIFSFPEVDDSCVSMASPIAVNVTSVDD